jgi:hypothetical protein
MIRSLPAFLVSALLPGAALAAEGSQLAEREIAAEHQRIESERHAAEARFEERRRDCEARFVVSGCIEEAKRERRDEMSRLRREQNALDDRERRMHVAERLDEIGKREEERARRAWEARSETTKHEVPERTSMDHARSPARQGSAIAPTPRNAPPAQDRLPRLGRLGSDRTPEEEARSRATFDAAQQAAARHRAEVEARNARRAREREPSAPLPVPPGASSP